MEHSEFRNKKEEARADHPADEETRCGYPPGAECAACGGRCCREHGCVLAPDDLLRALSGAVPDRATLLALFRNQEKGLYAVEYFRAPQGVCFYVRMRHKCYTFIGSEAMGECIALGKNGCMFSQEDRPRGGKMLKSSPDRQCVQHYTAEQMCEDWKPYQELLSGIYREWYARMREDGTFDRCDEDYFAWMKKNRTAHNVSGF